MRIRKGRFLIPATCLLFLATSYGLFHAVSYSKDYSRLVDLIKLRTREKPLYAFNDFEETFDEESHKANLEYFNENPNLVRKIQGDLDGGEVQWRLDNIMHRLLFVPERRIEYATLFESYCNDVIDYMLKRTGFANPFEKIEILVKEKPDPSSSNGITAYLVHNLAKEFDATYVFSNQNNKELTVRLGGKFFLGEVGSYTTHIYFRDDGTFEFTKNKYTIWQDSAKNPYTVLTVPVEETFHISLREYTNRAIKEDLSINPTHAGKGVEEIVEDWMAVEEAAAGGLVHALLPGFLRNHVNNLPESLIQKDLESKREFKKYRHLAKSIDLIDRIGYRAAIRTYAEDPRKFKRLLPIDGPDLDLISPSPHIPQKFSYHG